MVIQFNCKNCAAPLPNADAYSCCDYCGSDFRVIVKPDTGKYKLGGNTETKKDDSWKKLPFMAKVAMVLVIGVVPMVLLRKRF